MSESEQISTVADNSAEKLGGEDLNVTKNEVADQDDHSLLSESNDENELNDLVDTKNEVQKADIEEPFLLEEELDKDTPLDADNEAAQTAKESAKAVQKEETLAEEKVETPTEEKAEVKDETPVEQEVDKAAKHDADPVDTKEQTRLKKLEEARKKIERLKNKKKQNASKMASVEPISAPISPLNQQDSNVTTETSFSPLTVETNSRKSSDEKTIVALNATIAQLKNIIEDRDQEIKFLRLELEKQQPTQKQAQFSAPHNPVSPQIEEQYTEINFNDWKNYTLDMSTWRSIGSGPVVQF